MTATKLLRRTSLRPKLAIVLGTGFHGCLESLTPEVELAYDEIAGFPRAGVTGHKGQCSIHCVANCPVILLKGRAHFYEGYPMDLVTAAMRFVAACGVRAVLLTNAAGAINPKLRVGNFMVLADHINFMGVNPLRGVSGPDPARFLDLSQVYDPGLRRLLNRAGKDVGITLKKGVYVAVSGPTYETPAEIRALRLLGGDAVGMSTVPEAVVARACGLRVAGLSCITNLAAGRAKIPLTHREVLETAEKTQAAADQLLHRFVALYGARDQVSD